MSGTIYAWWNLFKTNCMWMYVEGGIERFKICETSWLSSASTHDRRKKVKWLMRLCHAKHSTNQTMKIMHSNLGLWNLASLKQQNFLSRYLTIFWIIWFHIIWYFDCSFVINVDMKKESYSNTLLLLCHLMFLNAKTLRNAFESKSMKPKSNVMRAWGNKMNLKPWAITLW